MIGTVTHAMKTRCIAPLAVVALVALAGCAAEPAPVKTATPAAVETEAPKPEVKTGDVLTAEQAAELNAGNDLAKAYPVGGEFIAVQWGQPIPEAVRAEVNTQVNVHVGNRYGTSTDADEVSAASATLMKVLKEESQKLGGITVTAVICAQSFSTDTNAFAPTWVISEPGPIGQYESKAAAFERADGWAQDGKKMYVVINNLGC